MNRYAHGGDIYSNKVEMDFSVNINPLGMPELVKEAIVSNLDRYESYPDPECRELCEAIAAREDVSRDYVLCGNGAADLIMRMCFALHPKRALVCAPTFSEYEKAVLLSQGNVKEHTLYEGKNFEVSSGILEDIEGTDVVFICTPNNPTGRLVDVDLLERCADKASLLVVDECFLSFTQGKSLKFLLETHPNLIILKAFTKIYAMAGLRLGYMLCSNEQIRQKIKDFGQSWSVSTVAQVAGISALKCNGWEEATRELIGKERDFLKGELIKLGLHVFPSDANYMLFKSQKPLHSSLLKKAILIRSCANYSNLSGNYYRIGIKKHDLNVRLIEAILEVING